MPLQTVAKQLTRTTKYRLNNGHHIPVAGFGVYQIPNEETPDLVYEALKQGYRHIDTAIMYGNQREVAQGIAKFLADHEDVTREDIWFTTKINNNDQGYEETKAAVARTADEVKEYIEYVDMFLIHSPYTSKAKRLETWKALQEFHTNPNNGVLQIRTIGVSNFGIHHIEELLLAEGFVVTPAVNQVELHPWLPKHKLREYAAKKGILLEAYMPLTRGEKFSDPMFTALCRKYNLQPAETLLKWSYLQGFIVLVKTSNKARVKENLAVLPPSHGTSDTLHEGSNLGKIDLDPGVLEEFEKFDEEVFCWGRRDPCEYHD